MQPDIPPLAHEYRPSAARRLRLVALPLAIGVSAAFAQPADAQKAALGATPVAQLKQVYLACDRAATRTVLDFATAAHCSMVGEALRRRAFGDDFDMLIAWWRAEKDAAAALADREPTRLGDAR